MSLNVGGIYVACTDRDRVVELIREYWLARGAVPMLRNPLDIRPLSLGKTADLGFVVSPPTRGKGQDGPKWIAIYDSERYHGDNELAAYLAEAMGVSAVVYGMHGASDVATIEGYGVPIPDLPASVDAAEDEEDHNDEDDSDEDGCCDDDSCPYGADWGEVETYVAENFPFPFLYYNQLQQDPDLTEFEREWAIFGFENIPHLPNAGYSGPDAATIRNEADKKEVEDCVARGDLARIEAIYAANPHIHYAILSAVAGTARLTDFDGSTDLADPVIRSLVLAFAERVFEDGGYWLVENVAQAAFLDDNAEVFDRACDLLGERTADLGPLAWKLLQAKDFERGYRLLRTVVGSPKASPVDWNNLAYALIPLVERERPADLEDLMAQASKHGAVNPAIWHNIACVWDKAGETGRAIDAVASARRDGYENMKAIAGDEDLAALRGDPRFEQALQGRSEQIRLSDLTRTTTGDGGTRTVNRPAVGFYFFFQPDDAAAFGRGAAAALARFCSDAPEGALTTYRSPGGPWKPLAKGKITRDVNQLSKLPADGEVFLHIHYRGAGTAEMGFATPYALDVEFVRFEDGHGWRSIQLFFPVELALEPEALGERFHAYAELLPYETGSCGLTLLTSKSDYVGNAENQEWAKRMQNRFYGFQHHPGQEREHGVCAGAHWLTLLGSGLLERIGGREHLAQLVPNAVVTDAAHGGACIRAALYPPVGLASAREDIGAMPEIARALEPWRTTRKKDDEQRAQLEELENGPYANTPPLL